jgi:hypothetical protein
VSTAPEGGAPDEGVLRRGVEIVLCSGDGQLAARDAVFSLGDLEAAFLWTIGIGQEKVMLAKHLLLELRLVPVLKFPTLLSSSLGPLLLCIIGVDAMMPACHG